MPNYKETTTKKLVLLIVLRSCPMSTVTSVGKQWRILRICTVCTHLNFLIEVANNK